jgi:integrase
MSRRTGSIDETITGRFRVRITHGGERKTLGIFDTRAEADVERTIAVEITGTGADPGVLFGTWVENFLDRRELGGKIRATRSERSYFKNHIAIDPLAQIAVQNVTRLDADDFVERVECRLATRGSVLKVVQICRGDEPWTFAELDEQTSLVAAARAHCKDTPRLAHMPIDALIDFAMGSGLRPGELVTLRLKDAHINAANPHVVVRFGSAPDGPTKTKTIREVQLFARAFDGLRRWIASLPKWCRENPQSLVFPRSGGGFRDEDHVIRWDDWKAILKRAGIDRRFRWYDLRHTCASALVSGMWGHTWALIVVRDMLGHESVTTTERYAHLSPTAIKDAAKATAKHWPRIRAAAAKKSLKNADENAGSRLSGLNRRPVLYEGAAIPAAASTLSPLFGHCEGHARSFLEATLACAVDAEVERLAKDLAHSVLATAPVRLAMEVLSHGPHTIARATELADIVLPDAEELHDSAAGGVA